MWSFTIPALTIVVELLSIMMAIRAIETARTSQGAVAWTIFILAVPVLGVLLYLVFGNIDHRRFRDRRRAAAASVTALHKPAPGEPEGDDRLRVFERLEGLRAHGGNGLDLLIDGHATYDAFAEAIATAERYVLVQFYIIRNDMTGQRLKEALIERAREGVAVYILHDSLRGFGLPHRSAIRELRKAGIEVRAPRGPRRPLGRFQINYRNHRKTIVVDGRVAFTGGLNVGDEHLGLDPRYGDWRDTHVEIHGPMVAQLQESFVADWYWTARQDLNPELAWSPPADPRDQRGLILSPAPIDPLETGNLYFCALAQAARTRLWIATPYFVPDNDVLSALKLAALRGVEVRILVPDPADHYLPWLAAFAYFDELREAGGEIWRYLPGFMHQKVALVDDTLASVGTINLDVRSGLLNFEETAIVDDRRFAAEVAAMLKSDFDRALRLDLRLDQQPKWIRYGAPAARLLAPLL